MKRQNTCHIIMLKKENEIIVIATISPWRLKSHPTSSSLKRGSIKTLTQLSIVTYSLFGRMGWFVACS